MNKLRIRRGLFGFVGCVLVVAITWLSLTNDVRVWPVRNTLQYDLFEQIDRLVGRSPGLPVTVTGSIRTPDGKPVPQAQVVLAAHDGTPYHAESDASGGWTISGVPAGEYTPVAGAIGYADTVIRRFGIARVTIDGKQPLPIVSRPAAAASPIAVPSDFRLDAPSTLALDKPIPSSAVRHVVHYTVGGRPNQTTLYYTPNDGQPTPLPLLLIVYPGPADQWETVSIPLSQAGFAVLAVGPDYALDLEPDVDDLERLLNGVRQGRFPRADGGRIGVLGGSYSCLHVWRLMERRDQPVRAALFLGPPTDLFELRRQFTAHEIAPPFGLDKAAIALGYPDRNPETYWRYSARYHARAFDVPIMLVHSKIDDVVPFQQSQIMDAELTRIGVPHELHILESMGHYLLATERTPAVDELFNLTTDFFQRELR